MSSTDTISISNRVTSKDSETTNEKAKLFALAEPYLSALQEFFRKEILEFEPEVQELVEYALTNSGKRLRPILVYMSGAGIGADFSEDLVKGGAIVEFVHLATLVHDDILDHAAVRHSRSSVMNKYGSSVAVLLGDALFSHALKLASDFPTVDICKIVSIATRKVCAGEINQTFLRGHEISLKDYFHSIELKTAELFKASCNVGAILGGQGKEFIEASVLFGQHLGTAYQIYDDLVDCIGSEDKAGKTLGTDLATGKYTLPIILLFEKLDSVEKEALLKELKESSTRPNAIARINELVSENDILNASLGYLNKEIEAAQNILKDHASEPAGQSLLMLLAFFQKKVTQLSSSE